MSQGHIKQIHSMFAGHIKRNHEDIILMFCIVCFSCSYISYAQGVRWCLWVSLASTGAGNPLGKQPLFDAGVRTRHGIVAWCTVKAVAMPSSGQDHACMRHASPRKCHWPAVLCTKSV
eukprot:1306472-Amphidinium_carterae.1